MKGRTDGMLWQSLIDFVLSIFASMPSGEDKLSMREENAGSNVLAWLVLLVGFVAFLVAGF